jgi:hypothetical protein
LDNAKILFKHCPQNVYTAFKEACIYGHKNIVDYILEFKSNIDMYNFGLNVCCFIGVGHIAEYMIHLGANNLNVLLKDINSLKHPHIIRLLIDSGATNIDEAFKVAQGYNMVDSMNILMKCGANISF